MSPVDNQHTIQNITMIYIQGDYRTLCQYNKYIFPDELLKVVSLLMVAISINQLLSANRKFTESSTIILESIEQREVRTSDNMKYTPRHIV